MIAPRLYETRLRSPVRRVVRSVRALALALVAALPLLAVTGAPAKAQSGNIFTSACSIFDFSTQVFLGIAVNGVCVDLSATAVPGTKPGLFRAVGTYTTGNSIIRFNVTWNADPFIEFSFSTTNIALGPETYAFPLATPIVPGNYGFATSALTLELAPGLLADGAQVTNNSSLSAAFLSGYGGNGAAITNLGVDLGTGPCTTTTTSVLCNYGTASSTFTPAFFDNLRSLLTYTQDGLGSTATFTGRVELFAQAPNGEGNGNGGNGNGPGNGGGGGGEPGPGPGPGPTVVPEPSTYALIALGLGALGFISRRRKGVKRA